MRVLSLVMLFLITLPVADVCGQKQDKDGPIGMFESREEYGRFIGSAKRASAGNPELQALIPLINDIALGQVIGATARKYNAAGSELGLLSDSRIREDIEMVDEQYQELKDLQSDIQKRLAEQLRAIDFTDPESVANEFRKIRDEAEKDLNAVLLPHQVKRLRQIRMQSLLRRRSLAEVLTSDPIKSDLEITETQSEELKEFQQELQQEYQKEVAKLQEKARDRLISRLNPSQKSQVKEMIGDAFEFSQPSKVPSGGKVKATKDKQTKPKGTKEKGS